MVNMSDIKICYFYDSTGSKDNHELKVEKVKLILH